MGAPGDIDDIGGSVNQQEPAQFAGLGVDLLRGELAAAGAAQRAGSGDEGIDCPPHRGLAAEAHPLLVPGALAEQGDRGPLDDAADRPGGEQGGDLALGADELVAVHPASMSRGG